MFTKFINFKNIEYDLNVPFELTSLLNMDL